MEALAAAMLEEATSDGGVGRRLGGRRSKQRWPEVERASDTGRPCGCHALSRLSLENELMIDDLN